MKRTKLERAVKELLDILDYTEKTRKGTEFHPVTIRSIGPDLSIRIYELLKIMKKEV